MKTVFADFNAMSEAGHLRLNFRVSQADLQELGARPGDWVWLSDGELVVGAQLAQVAEEGLVGIPAWDTLVHLDDEGADDPVRVWSELEPLLKAAAPSPEIQRRTFEVMVQLEHTSSRPIAQIRPGFFALQRASLLNAIGRPELALVEIENARRDWPGESNIDFHYFDILRQVAPYRALREAQALAASPHVSAPVLVAVINLLAAHGQELPDDRFAPTAHLILGCYERFDRAPGRDDIDDPFLSLVHFYAGLALLRLGRVEEGRRALELAHEIDPDDPSLEEATRLATHDQHAGDIARRVRSKLPAA